MAFTPLIRQASPATFSHKGRREMMRYRLRLLERPLNIQRLRQNHRLGPVLHAQLAEDAGQVRLDGGLGDAQVEGDLLVQPPDLQPLQNPQLRRRQAGDAGLKVRFFLARRLDLGRPASARRMSRGGCPS